jgi:hypothetical protein
MFRVGRLGMIMEGEYENTSSSALNIARERVGRYNRSLSHKRKIATCESYIFVKISSKFKVSAPMAAFSGSWLLNGHNKDITQCYTLGEIVGAPGSTGTARVVSVHSITTTLVPNGVTNCKKFSYSASFLYHKGP